MKTLRIFEEADEAGVLSRNTSVWRFYIPIFLFVFSDTIGLRFSLGVQLVFAVASYLFVCWMALQNLEKGITYYIAFSLTCVRLLAFDTNQRLMNFGELRVGGGFTINLMIGIFLAICVLRTSLTKCLKPVFGQQLLWTLFAAGICNGLFLVILGENYLSFFFNDLLRYAPIPLYLILVSALQKDSIKQVVLAYVLGTFLLTILSWIFGIYRSYGGLESKFLLQNVGSRVYFPMLLLLGLQNKECRWMLPLALFYGWLIVSGKTLIEGKAAIFIFLFLPFSLLSLFTGQKRLKFLAILSMSLLLPLLALLCEWIRDIIAENGEVYASKMRYLIALLTRFDYAELVNDPTMGSLAHMIAEGATLINNLFANPYYFLAGKGFGGAMHDSFGYLWRSAGSGGYPLISLQLDAYLTPHFAPYCVGLKLGIVGLAVYALCSIRLAFSPSVFAALAFLVWITYLFATKESTLFGILLLRCATLEDASLLYPLLSPFRFRNK